MELTTTFLVALGVAIVGVLTTIVIDAVREKNRRPAYRVTMIVVLVALLCAAAALSVWPQLITSSSPSYPEQKPLQDHVISRVVVITGSDCQTSNDQKRCWVGVWSLPVHNNPPAVTRVQSGTQLKVFCYRDDGETIWNGAIGQSSGRPIPGVTESNVWFWIETPDGKQGYIPRVWTGSVTGPVDVPCTFKRE